MGLTERHWFEDEYFLNERQLEKAIEDEKAAYERGLRDGSSKTNWINVKDRLPAEIHSIFWPWYGRKEWRNAMWREQSEKVLVTVVFEDGTRLVATGETHDGEWYTSISKTLNPIVTHWMPLPEPPKEDDGTNENH